MARFLAILLIGAGTAAGFMKAAVPHQETAVHKAVASDPLSAAFDDGLDNADVVSDMNIHPARKCGFCMGVSALHYDVQIIWLSSTLFVSIDPTSQ